MDFYDKTRSKLGNSAATPEAGIAHATGLEEHPTCDSDIYLGYEQATTREIINAIEGASITRDATDLTQLFQAIQSEVATTGYVATLSTLVTGTAIVGFTNLSIGAAPTGKKAIQIRVHIAGTTSANAFKIQIKDSNGVIFTIVNLNPPSDQGGERFETGIGFFDASGAGTMQYSVIQTLGASNAGLAFEIERWGWI